MSRAKRLLKSCEWAIASALLVDRGNVLAGENGGLLYRSVCFLGERRITCCLCVCVCVFSSHSFWTSSSLDVPAGVTQEEGHTGFLIHLLSAVRALLFLARRVQPFLSLVDREVVFFCLLTN